MLGRKRICAAILSVIMLFGIINVNIYADTGEANLTVEAIGYDNENQKITVKGSLKDGAKFENILIEAAAANADRSDFDAYLSECRNLGQIRTDSNGRFENSFVLNDDETGIIEIFVTAPTYGETVAKTVTVSQKGDRETNLSVDSVSYDNTKQKITIKGSLKDKARFETVLIETVKAGTDRNNFDEYLSGCLNMGQVKTDMDGAFRHSFALNDDEIGGAEIYVTAPKNNETIERTLILSRRGTDERVLDNSVVMQAENKIAAVFGQKGHYLKNVPYTSGENIMIAVNETAELLGANVNVANGTASITLNGKTTETETENNNNTDYINAAGLESLDLKVWQDITTGTVVISKLTGENNFDNMINSLGVYMSPDGNDSNQGTFNSPVNSFEKALQLAEERPAPFGKHIYARGGRYEFKKGSTIEDEDDFSVEAYDGEKVIFSGSVKLNKNDFELLESGEAYSRLKGNARGKVYKLNLKKYLTWVESIDNCGLYGYYNLYENDNQGQLGRWPDKTYGVKAPKSISDAKTVLDFSDVGAQWLDETKPYLGGFMNSSYATEQAKLTMNSDLTGSVKVKFANDGRPVYAYNMLCETDIPGEWYIENGILYYYPMYDLQNVEIAALKDSMFTVKNCNNVTFDGITIERMRGNAITAVSASNMTVANSNIKQIRGTGISIVGGGNNTVENCEIFSVGESAVQVSAGNYKNLTNSNTNIKNCRIYDFSSNGNASAAGIQIITSDGVTVDGCTIHDSPAHGITATGSEIVVKNNEVYNVVNYMSDAGAIYFNAGYGHVGNKVINNYLHDIKGGYKGGGDVFPIYMDDMTGFAEVSGNLIMDSDNAGQFGGGRENVVKNNVFVNLNMGFKYDGRGILRPKNGFHWAPMTSSVGGTLENGFYGTLVRMINEGVFDEENNVFYTRYPQMKLLVGDVKKEWKYYETKAEEDKYDAGKPINNITENNLFIYPTTLETPRTFAAWYGAENYIDQSNNLTAAKSFKYNGFANTEYKYGDGGASFCVQQAGIVNTAVRNLDGILTPGHDYKVECRILSVNCDLTPGGNGPRVDVSIDSKLLGTSGFETNGVWKKLTTSIFTATEDMTAMKLDFVMWHGGEKLCIDDIKFIDLTDNTEIVFDDFNDTVYRWVQPEAKNELDTRTVHPYVFENNAQSWFEDFENGNYQIKSGTSLFDSLPGFEINNFKIIGADKRFTTAAKPYLVSPQNGGSYDENVHFIWNKYGENEFFRLIVSKNEDLSNPVYTANTVLCELKTKLNPGTYYYAVEATDKSKSKNGTKISDVKSFTVNENYEVNVLSCGYRQNGETVTEPAEGNATAFINSEYVNIMNETAAVIFAHKSANGSLIDVKEVDVTKNDSKSDIEYGFEYKTGDTVDVYIWDSLNTMFPYHQKITL